MNKKKSISFYIIWLIIFMLLMAAVITVGVYRAVDKPLAKKIYI